MISTVIHYRAYILEVKNDKLTQLGVINKIRRLMMTDKTIHTSIVLQVCLCMSQTTETETEYTEEKREVHTDLKLSRTKMESQEQNKSSAKCSDFAQKGSLVASLMSLLLIVALFLRMEAINSKTAMNGIRISKVEAHIRIITQQTTNQDKDMKFMQGRHVARYHYHGLVCTTA